mgnify:CR=1 FL=1
MNKQIKTEVSGNDSETEEECNEAKFSYQNFAAICIEVSDISGTIAVGLFNVCTESFFHWFMPQISHTDSYKQHYLWARN